MSRRSVPTVRECHCAYFIVNQTNKYIFLLMRPSALQAGVPCVVVVVVVVAGHSANSALVATENKTHPGSDRIGGGGGGD